MPTTSSVFSEGSHQDTRDVHKPNGLVKFLSEAPAHNFEVVWPKGGTIEGVRHAHEEVDLLLI